ncbi:MAG: hypothetical protein AAF138_04600 [Planctomycetota bacterium]
MSTKDGQPDDARQPGSDSPRDRQRIDDLLDRAMPDAQRAKMYEWLGEDSPEARSESDYLFGVRDLESALKGDESIAAPDFTHRVLSDVGRRRGFLNRRGRRLVLGSRMAIACGLLGLLVVFAAGRRMHPELFSMWRSDASSIGQVESAAQADAGGAIRAIEAMVDRAMRPEPAAMDGADTRLAWIVDRAATPRLRELDLGSIDLRGMDLSDLDLGDLDLSDLDLAVIDAGRSDRSASGRDAGGWIWADASIRAEVGVSCGADAGLGVTGWSQARFVAGGVLATPLHPVADDTAQTPRADGGLRPLGARNVPSP